jgi:hypothetical protein
MGSFVTRVNFLKYHYIIKSPNKLYYYSAAATSKLFKIG